MFNTSQICLNDLPVNLENNLLKEYYFYIKMMTLLKFGLKLDSIIVISSSKSSNLRWPKYQVIMVENDIILTFLSKNIPV